MDTRRRRKRFRNGASPPSPPPLFPPSHTLFLLRLTTEPTETGRDLLHSNEDDNDQPVRTTGQQILDLAVPAAGALLMDPLLTLADTVFVGRFPSSDDAAAPLAGMGSASALLVFAFYLFNFLCTATTPLVAQKRAEGQTDQAAALGGQVLSLALLLGSLLTVLLLSFPEPLLRLYGTSRTGEAAQGYARAFLSVRALAAPAVLCVAASTGILRGWLDAQTTVAVLIVANVTNLILDVVLIVILPMGPVGAAMATTTAEWISAGLFLAVLAGRLPSAASIRRRRTGTRNQLSNDDDDGQTTDAGGSALSVAIVPALAVPPWNEMQPLLTASASVFVRAVILQTFLSAAAAMAARSGGAAVSCVAAHQIGIQLWLLGSFLCDSLAAASQGLVADALGRHDRNGVLDVTRTIFRYSLGLGLVLAGLLQLAFSANLLLELFTADLATQDSLRAILPLIILAQPLNALVFAADGVLQGASEFPFQAKAMAISGLAAVGTFVALEAMMESGTTSAASTDTLVHVWLALIALQMMRGLTSLWKLVDANGPINVLSIKQAL